MANPGPLKAILPNAVIGAVLMVVVIVLLVAHQRVAAFVVLGLDAVNLIVLRVRLARWVRRSR